jgi:glycosyltransferase involved in cell wall biosynthesis
MTSVVVPVYNGAHVLGWSVPAVLALDGVDECVWVDDGSTDATAETLRALVGGDPRARVVRLDSNRGRAAARNVGASVVSGETLVFLDADVRPPSDLVRAFESALDALGAIATAARISFSGLDASDPYHLYLQRHPRGVPDLPPGAAVPWRFFVTTAGAVRREAFEASGGFDEAVAYGEDLALACALAERAPHGFVSSGATVEMTDAGTLDTALAKIEAFAHALVPLADRRPDVYRLARLGRLVNPGVGVRVAGWAPVARSVRRSLGWMPRSLRVQAVRYLLGRTLLHAHADAQLLARTRR